MGRPKIKALHKKVKVKCAWCGEPLERTVMQENYRKKAGNSISCSPKCSGRMGGFVSARVQRKL